MVLSDTGVTKGWQRNQMPAYGDAVTVKFWYWSISILGVHTGDLADTVCGCQKAAVLGRDTGKALLLITLPQCLPRWFPAVKKKSFCLKSKDIFSHFSHACSLLQRKKLQFLWKWGCGWKVRGKGSKKKKTALIAATCPQWEIDVSALSLRKLVSPPLLNLHRILHSWCVK